MARCMHTEICSFFTAEVGYSPELNHAMKERYCLDDNSDCARLLAMDVIGMENVPDEMLPGDHEMLEQFKAARA